MTNHGTCIKRCNQIISQFNNLGNGANFDYLTDDDMDMLAAWQEVALYIDGVRKRTITVPMP